ncbi:hypothetical protein QCE63_26365 [Caballeronia sp. LZ065]|uniref:hypothetical protein n=1 Tax=Caballeronia sp. LZ065 TaxID=3038571 RepID=UPI0028651749|nr:hypothetical protein [Caballeronia sp. LZ065]MDR5782936.1 hypothetical protein [Caballeronia sp. LZ065]
MRFLNHSAILILVVALCGRGAWAQQKITGTVLDPGEGAGGGIPGVKVTVKQAGGTTIKTDITTIDGRYSVELPSGTRLPVVAEFSKISYVDDPMVVPVTETNIKDLKVYLAHIGQQQAYYNQIALNIAQQSNVDQRTSQMYAVAALPLDHKDQVAQALATRGDPALVKQLAETNSKRTAYVQVRDALQESKAKNVYATPDFKGSNIFINGDVASQWNKNKIENVINSQDWSKFDSEVKLAPLSGSMK